jgi:hypothetical protein
MNLAREDLKADPEAVCEQLSGMIGEEYDFEKGEIIMPRKLNILADTVLRKNIYGIFFLMNRQDTGWASASIPIPSVEDLLKGYNVRIGDLTKDKYSEYYPVYKEDKKQNFHNYWIIFIANGEIANVG